MSDILEKFIPIPEDSESIPHTASSMTCYMKCPRLYQYRYTMGYRTAADIPALLVGSATHVGLEWFWKGASYHEAMVKVCEYMDKEPYFSGDGKVDAARVSAYVKGYYTRWGQDKSKYDVIGVEMEFYTPPWYQGLGKTKEARAGKLDVLVREKDTGALIIIDHKTAGPYSKADEAASHYWLKLAMDTQIHFYSECVEYIADEDVSFVYDVVMKTRSSPTKSRAKKRKNETDAEFLHRKNADNETLPQYRERVMNTYVEEAAKRYIRKVVPLTARDKDEKREEIADVSNEILTGSKYKRRRNTSSCNSYGSVCEFMGVCTGVELLDDPKFIKKETAHEELQKKEETL